MSWENRIFARQNLSLFIKWVLEQRDFCNFELDLLRVNLVVTDVFLRKRRMIRVSSDGEVEKALRRYRREETRGPWSVEERAQCDLRLSEEFSQSVTELRERQAASLLPRYIFQVTYSCLKTHQTTTKSTNQTATFLLINLQAYII